MLQVECPAPKFFFTTKAGVTIDVTQQCTVDHHMEMPNPLAYKLPKSTDFLALAPNKIYSGKSNTSGQRNQMIRALHNTQMMGIVYEKFQRTSPTLEEDEADFMDSIVKAVLNVISHYFGFGKIFFQMLICISVVIFIVFLLKLRIVRWICRLLIEWLFYFAMIPIQWLIDLYNKFAS